MQNNTLLTIIAVILPTIVSFLTVNWVYFKVLKIAKEKQLVDNPDARKLQKAPVPVLGGIAVFAGMLTGVLVGSAFCNLFNLPSVAVLLPVVLAMSAMIYTGAMDDLIGLTPTSRFAIEIFVLLGIILASGLCVDDLQGLFGVHQFNWWVGVICTVFGGVGIINAINMIDGVNGLSSGLCITYCILFGAVFLKVDDVVNAQLAFIMAAAIVPFFLHNVFGNRSRMFIGDAGTMMMGVLLTWFVIASFGTSPSVWNATHGSEVNLIAMALAILSVPVFDTLRVMSMRMAKKKSPFQPDKTHLHHVFVKSGVSHSITAFTEIVIDLIVFGVWRLLVFFGASSNWQLILVIIVSVVLVWGLYFFLNWHEEHHTELQHRLTHIAIRTHLGDKNWWQSFEKFLDGPETKNAKTNEVHEEPKSGLTVDEFYKFDTITPDNLKEMDRKRVYDFIKGKAEVYMDDIKDRSGADPLRIDVIIGEGVAHGFISVIKEGVYGMPMIVTFIERVQP